MKKIKQLWKSFCDWHWSRLSDSMAWSELKREMRVKSVFEQKIMLDEFSKIHFK